jgi:hypothetical protein
MHNQTMLRALRCALIVSIGLATSGCQKLQGVPGPQQTGIPAALGELVGVTPDVRPFQSVLWFKQADQTIVAVRVNFSNGNVGAQVVKFPRT